MADKKITKAEEDAALKHYLLATNAERNEMHRYTNEIEYLDEIFMPVDFDLLKQNDDLQLKRRAYNAKIIQKLMKVEKNNNNKKVFKYVSYQQMADIYVSGTMAREEITAEINTSSDGHFYPLQFSDVAKRFKSVKETIAKKQNL